MLKKISLAVVVLFSIVMLNSCSKESVALSKIDGTWTMQSLTVNGANVPLGTTIIKLTFDKCKSKAAICSGNSSIDGVISAFQYEISVDGSTVTLDPGTVDEEAWTIKENTKATLVISATDGVDTYQYNLEK